MNYDTRFSNILKPFMVVSAPYVDLTGNIKTFANGDIQRGLFMIARADDNGNVLAFKITSQRSKYINEFTYIISNRTHTFLRTDSYVQLDKWHTLDAKECQVLGVITPSLRMAILRKIDSITREVDKCLKDNMSWEHVNHYDYQSPNKKLDTSSEYSKLSRLKYLQNKEKCCNLDKQELLELVQLEREFSSYVK